MKLRNKLLPFATVLVTATTVAPFAIACTSSSSQKAYCDITQPITPSKKAAKTTSALSKEQALDIYVEAVKNDPTILQQDLWYYEHNRLPERLVELEYYDFVNETTSTTQVNSISNVTANIICDDIKINTVEYLDEGVKSQFHTISMTLGYEFSFKALSIASDPRLDLTETYKFTSTYKDIPLWMSSKTHGVSGEEIQGQWWLSIDLFSEDAAKWLTYVPGWSWSYSYDKEYSYTYQEGESITTGGNKNSYGDTFTRVSQIEALRDQYNKTIADLATDLCLNFTSYYMSDVLVNEVDDPIWVATGAAPEINVYIDNEEKYEIGGFEDSQTLNIFNVYSYINTVTNLYFEDTLIRSSLNNANDLNAHLPIFSSYISTSKGNTPYDNSSVLYLKLNFDAQAHKIYSSQLDEDEDVFYFENELTVGEKIYIYIPSIFYRINFATTEGWIASDSGIITQPIRFTLKVNSIHY